MEEEVAEYTGFFLSFLFFLPSSFACPSPFFERLYHTYTSVKCFSFFVSFVIIFDARKEKKSAAILILFLFFATVLISRRSRVPRTDLLQDRDCALYLR